MHSANTPNPSYFSGGRGGGTAGSGWQVLNEASLHPLCALEIEKTTMEHNDEVSSTVPPTVSVEHEWNKGEITTPPTWPATEGRTFTLYLLTAMPPGYFSCISEQLEYDARDSTDFEHCCDLAVQRYKNMCDAM
jgi:hypothetical protein